MAEPENQEPLSPLLRIILRDWMERTMSDIREDRYAAGWMSGIEDEIWDDIQGLPAASRYGESPRDAETLERLKFVSDLLGEWIDGARFIPLSEWRKREG